MAASDNRIPKRHFKGRRSCGPNTEQGKKIASQNSCKHGILSKRLLLSDESPEDFEALFQGLVNYFEPIGTLECAIVEKIAINLWRQRRLVAAEAASIEVDRTAQLENFFLPIQGSSSNLAINNDKNFLDEFRKFYPKRESITAEQIEKEAKVIWERMMVDSLKEQGRHPLFNVGDRKSYIDAHPDIFWDWAHNVAESIESKMKISEGLLETLKTAYTLPIHNKVIYRYEVMLDREFYSALSALMLLQGARFRGAAGLTAVNQAKRPRMAGRLPASQS